MAGTGGETGSMTRKERERAGRREAIIDAAEELFGAKGFENTTMEEIAEKAEFGKPTLYSYFKGKDEILFRVHMRRHGVKVAGFREAIEAETTGYEKLRALGGAYYRFYKANPEYLRMQIHWDYQGLTFDRVSDTVQDQYNELVSTSVELGGILRLGAKDGSLRSDLDIDRTMDLFFMTLRTVANQVLLIEPPLVSQLDDNSESMYFYYLDLFLQAVRARDQNG
jgi:AcrR family transcriptional regulator